MWILEQRLWRATDEGEVFVTVELYTAHEPVAKVAAFADDVGWTVIAVWHVERTDKTHVLLKHRPK